MTHQESPNQNSQEQFVWQGLSVALQELSSGTHSSAYGFEAPDGIKVLRVNKETDYGFEKDALAADHYASTNLPVPKVDLITRSPKGEFVAVSEWRTGRRIHDMPLDDKIKTIPATLAVVGAMHDTKLKGKGYGWWNKSGNAEYPSWRAVMEKFLDSAYDPDMNQYPLYNVPLMRDGASAAKKLIDWCPEKRNLVHGDLSSNALYEGSRATAVIDWSHSMFGDTLYDVAELDAHTPDIDYESIFKSYYEAQGRLPVNFHERVLCYKILINIADLRYFARANEAAHNSTKQKQLAECIRQAQLIK